MYDEKKWMDIVARLDFAFQPIVNTFTGDCLGYEALLRNYDALGFRSPREIFNSACIDQVLYKFDLALREKAITKLVSFLKEGKFKLFYNLDGRALSMIDYLPGKTVKILAKHNLSPGAVCFEISEQNEFNNKADITKALNIYRLQQFKIAIDNFGTGYSGLKLFYHSEPDFIKIDRFFITGISHDTRKKLFISKIVNMAHLMGIYLIAGGIEDKEEYYTCKEIGCDFVQGYFIQRPTTDISLLRGKYEEIEQLSIGDRRERPNDQRIIFEQMEYISSILITTDMQTVFEIFRNNECQTFFPLTDEHNEPLGLIHEKDLKKYVFSRYGKELLANPSSGKNLKDFIIKSPVASITMPVEEILEIFNMYKNAEGIIIVQNTHYIGFLTAKSLLNVLNEKNIAIARDQNPLTHLSGNNLIREYISRAIQNNNSQHIFIYFDFDNFKPFNDKYGFREGDRAILLFSEILRRKFTASNCFIGHIGGDDFFSAFENLNFEEANRKVTDIIQQFRNDVESFYDAKARKDGYIIAKDREENIRKIPLLTVSAVILQIRASYTGICFENISSIMALMKKSAKSSPDKISAASIWRHQNNQDQPDIKGSSKNNSVYEKLKKEVFTE